MKYTENNLIYEAQNYIFIPYRNLVLIVGPVFLIGLVAVVWLGLGSFYGIFAICFILLIGLAMSFTYPRKFQVYDDHISITYWLRNKNARFSSIHSVGYVIVQPPTYSWGYFFERPSHQVVRISKINGDHIDFNPFDSKSFIEESTKALENWRRKSSGISNEFSLDI